MSISVWCECGEQFESLGGTRAIGCRARLAVARSSCPARAALGRVPRRVGSGTVEHEPQGDREPRAGPAVRLRVPERPAGDPLRLPGPAQHRQERGAAPRSGDGRRRDRPRGDRLPVHDRAHHAHVPLGRCGGRACNVHQQPQADRPGPAQLPRGLRQPAARRDHRQGRTAAPELAGRHPPLHGSGRSLRADSTSTSPGTAPTTSPCSSRGHSPMAAPAIAP